ncbi:MAG: ATP-binding cassette domain-containing protein [Myxococcales bacterium]|nr:ATP-binding cassette domain-containing protein [Myxococcales bacterium]
MSEPMIALRQAGLAYDDRPVFVDVDLAVAGGEVVVIGAPAGAGATALIELLTGQRQAVGTVAVVGRDLARLRASSLVRLRRRLGVVPQDLALVADATAGANVELALEVAGVRARERRRRATAALAAVDVAPHRAIASLSMAARQRVAWARAFVRNPDVVIADQPTCHQDGDGTARFVEALRARIADGAAAVVTSRDPALLAAAGRLGWRVLTIHRHRLVDPATVVVEAIDAAPHVEAEIERPTPEAEAVPNVVPFPVARSAGNRR